MQGNAAPLIFVTRHRVSAYTRATTPSHAASAQGGRGNHCGKHLRWGESAGLRP
jgi:hypothetical protein